MKSNKTTVIRTVLIIIPFILVTLIMLPRLISPQFGFFDDARMLAQSKKFLRSDFSLSHDRQAGRFRPIYWLYYALIYALAGFHPFWFFLGNLFLFFILLYELRLILRDMGCSKRQIFVTSLIFIFTMPIIENFYTLSKGEPLQLVLILASIIFAQRIKSKDHNQWIVGALSTLSLLLAIMVKETAIVMLPVTFLWAAFAFFKHDDSLKKEKQASLFVFSAAGLAVLLYFLLRKLCGATALLGGTYTDRYLVDLSAQINKVLRWMTQFAFYFHYLLPLILILLLMIIFKDSFTKQEKFNFLQWGIWWLLWFLILVPWEYAELYYLLPFGFGSATLIGIIIPAIQRAIQSHRKVKRALLIVLSVASVLLFLLTLPNYLTDAKTQLTFDLVNQKMLTFIVDYAADDATIFTNIETSNEYSEKLEVSLREHYHLTGITYGNINAERLENLTDQTNALVLMPFIDNQPKLTVRAGVEEIYQKRWNEKMLTQTEGKRTLLEKFHQSFRLSNVNLPLLICPLIGEAGFCEDPDPIIDIRQFTYGWDVYQID